MEISFFNYQITFVDKTHTWVYVTAKDRKQAERIMLDYVIMTYSHVLRYECLQSFHPHQNNYASHCCNANTACKGQAGYFTMSNIASSTWTPNGFVANKGEFVNCSRSMKLEKLFDGVHTESN